MNQSWQIIWFPPTCVETSHVSSTHSLHSEHNSLPTRHAPSWLRTFVPLLLHPRTTLPNLQMSGSLKSFSSSLVPLQTQDTGKKTPASLPIRECIRGNILSPSALFWLAPSLGRGGQPVCTTHQRVGEWVLKAEPQAPPFFHFLSLHVMLLCG